ncbi:uncharacterized protein LOC141898835 isoform X2 [Tubulanus polymorphus]|uniref:uncharacterized protein LOC141898835 isoform X2 n=1 Tax=Tubulanus polymorphus TaxID=672921 RepID=UPI003DA432A3
MDDKSLEGELPPLYDSRALEQLLRGMNSANFDFVSNPNNFLQQGLCPNGNIQNLDGFQQWSNGFSHYPKEDDPLSLSWQNLSHLRNAESDFSQPQSGHTSPTFSSGETSPTYVQHNRYPVYEGLMGNFNFSQPDLNTNTEPVGLQHQRLFGDKLDSFGGNLNFGSLSQDQPKFQQPDHNRMQTWTNSMPEYHPFQSSTVLHDQKDLPPVDIGTHQETKPKRSYSDVAKKQPETTANIARTKFKEKRSSSLPEELKAPTPPPVFKQRKKTNKPRGAKKMQQHQQPVEILGSNVEPDAKYGLDTFDDPIQNEVKNVDKSSGIDDVDEIPANVFTKMKSAKLPSENYHPSRDAPADLSHGKAKKSAEKQGPFFDPKRIFQSKPNNNTANCSSSSKSKVHSNIEADCNGGSKASGDIDEYAFVLNNGKCCPTFTNTAAATKATTYINNDLRDRSEPRKQTNTDVKQNHANRSQSCSETRTSKSSKGSKDVYMNGAADQSSRAQRKTNKKKSRHAQVFGQICGIAYQWCYWFLVEVLLALIILVAMVSYRLLIILIMKIYQYIVLAITKTYTCIKSRVQSWCCGANRRKKAWSANDSQYQSYGLDENIVLPTTGEEAMKRLLAGKGKDPYSILGLKNSCTDDDIKRYYRKQAILVHPDKNSQPGAEEAFKILGHAIEIIGKPEKRALYDQQFHENKAAEEAMKEFSDMLTKLREKVQEAAYLMRCDQCGGKHHRIPVDRPWYSARHCEKCNTRHSAKEGDLWAESTFLGFLWYYYACMDGKIFDITEWASCQQENFRHMQANAHYVMYRIATNSNRNNHHQHGRSSGTMQSDHQESHKPYPGPPGSQSTNRPAWNPGPASAGKTGKKRRKKKH